MSEGGGGGGGGLGGGGSPNPADKAKQDALFEDREPKKIIRIITVMAYMCSVSFVGVVLSAYYIFLWHPPNPRLMHQQVAHHDARVDYLQQPADFTTVRAVDRNVLDLFKHASPGAETLKTRREIVKNVNAILSANFEKVRFTEASGTTEGPKFFKLNDMIDAFTPSKAPEDPSTASEISLSSSSPAENEKLSSYASEDSTPDDKTTTESTLTPTSSEIAPPSRRTKRPGKKPHQTPFALKHLEVPIKLEPTRRRPIRFSTTTTTRSDTSSIADSSEGTLSDMATSSTASSSSSSSPDSSEVSENASPRHAAKSLYKMLTSPPQPSLVRDIDYSGSTDLPQIFPAVAHANGNNDNDDYRDATIAPLDDLIDD